MNRIKDEFPIEMGKQYLFRYLLNAINFQRLPGF